MRTALLAFVSLALAGVPAARAAEPDYATLQQEVKVLKQMVQDLQRRMAAIEGRSGAPAQGTHPAPQAAQPGPQAAQPAPQMAQPAPQVAQPAPHTAQTVPQAAPIAAAQPGASPSYMSPEALLKASWNQVEKGMDQAAVTALLGAPSTTFLLDGRRVWYYYYPGTGRGSVFFTDAGRVSSYQSPFLGFGW